MLQRLLEMVIFGVKRESLAMVAKPNLADLEPGAWGTFNVSFQVQEAPMHEGVNKEGERVIVAQVIVRGIGAPEATVHEVRLGAGVVEDLLEESKSVS